MKKILKIYGEYHEDAAKKKCFVLLLEGLVYRDQPETEIIGC